MIMNLCPYTWVRQLMGEAKPNSVFASYLRVIVRRDGDTKVDVSLPANSARWLIDLIPEDVIAKIREEKIPIDAIQADLARKKDLYPTKIFLLTEPNRQVEVWLE